MGNISALTAVAAFVASLSLGVSSWAQAKPCRPTARLHPLRHKAASPAQTTNLGCEPERKWESVAQLPFSVKEANSDQSTTKSRYFSSSKTLGRPGAEFA